MSDTKKYTASDFQRYHRGLMSHAEMHALEKAALDDPFLSDALDGYAFTEQAEEEVTGLKEAIGKKTTTRSRYKPLFVAGLWWKIAASLLILFGISYFFLLQNQDTSQPGNFAVQKSAQEHNAPVAAAPSTLDTTYDDIAANLQPQAKKKSELPIDPRNRTNIGRSRQADQPMRQAEKAEAMPAPALNESTNDMAVTMIKPDTISRFQFSGHVTDKQGTPVPFANLKISGRENLQSADANGFFNLTSPDSSVVATITALGFQASSVKLKQSHLATIKLDRGETELETEVVTTGYATKKAAAKSLAGKTAGVTLNRRTNAFPVNDAFEDYLDGNTLPVYDEEQNELIGDVTLEFQVSAQGRPQNINVLSSTCRGCETQAVQLLKSGPNWKKQKNNKGTVNIRFPRNSNTR